MRLKDKVAVVTGSGRGIGEAIAYRLAEEGAKIVINDIHEENAQNTLAKIESLGRDAMVVIADIAKEEGAKNLIEEAVAKFGRVDILVNNAGINRDMLVKDMTEKDWDLVLDLDLKGTFFCCKFVSRYMVEQKSGKIVNISSRAWHGNPGQANYSAAKAGVIGLTKSLAWEFGRYDINVNAVAPGLILTELTKSHPKIELIKERQFANMPIKRLGEPVDIANTVLFLVSDESNFITGEVIHVTGGRFG